jgi:hypothetical protein
MPPRRSAAAASSLFRCAPPRADASPLATHLPALSCFLYVLFGERSDAPPALAPLWQYAVVLVALGEIAAWAAGMVGATFVPLHCAMIVAWFCSPAWLLPVQCLAPLLRDVFAPGNLLLRQQRLAVTWAVEVSVALVVPASVLVNVLVRIYSWPRMKSGSSGATSGPAAFWSMNVLGALIYILYMPVTLCFMFVVVLVCTLHVAELELLAHHWKRRTRHAFLEAQPPAAQWALLCLRCPRRVRRAGGLARCCGAARGAAWCLYRRAWAPASGIELDEQLADVSGATAPAAAPPKKLVLAAQQDDDERIGRPMNVLSASAAQGDRFVEPTLDLIIESFASTRRSIQLTSSTLGFEIALVLAVCAAAMVNIVAAGLRADRINTYPGGDTSYLVPAVFWAVAVVIVVPVVSINRKWRAAEQTLSQNVVMYKEMEQLRLMALLARNPIELTLFGIPATTATGSLYMAALTLLLLLSAYCFARSIGPCSVACAVTDGR